MSESQETDLQARIAAKERELCELWPLGDNVTLSGVNAGCGEVDMTANLGD